MSATADHAEGDGRVWVLNSTRTGDNGQLAALAGQLPCAIAHLDVAYNPLHACPNRLLGAGCASIRAVSPPPSPPWPALVIGVGRRSVPLARWVRDQSGGRTKLVQLGRPRAPLDWFDLVVTTPQYGLPPGANVLENPLPLHAISAARLAEARAAWQERLAHLPRPRTAIFVGGPTWGYRMDVAFARRLARRANAFTRASGGSLLISTAPRTPPAVADALAAEIEGPADCYLWHLEAGGRANPFLGFLALADRFWVSEESVSMLAETSATGQPVDVVPLPRPPGAELVEALAQSRLKAGYTDLVERGLLTPPRRIRSVHERLVELGLARWREGVLEVRIPPDGRHDALARTVARVRALMPEQQPVPSGAAGAALRAAG